LLQNGGWGPPPSCITSIGDDRHVLLRSLNDLRWHLFRFDIALVPQYIQLRLPVLQSSHPLSGSSSSSLTTTDENEGKRVIGDKKSSNEHDPSSSITDLKTTLSSMDDEREDRLAAIWSAPFNNDYPTCKDVWQRAWYGDILINDLLAGRSSVIISSPNTFGIDGRDQLHGIHNHTNYSNGDVGLLYRIAQHSINACHLTNANTPSKLSSDSAPSSSSTMRQHYSISLSVLEAAGDTLFQVGTDKLLTRTAHKKGQSSHLISTLIDTAPSLLCTSIDQTSNHIQRVIASSSQTKNVMWSSRDKHFVWIFQCHITTTSQHLSNTLKLSKSTRIVSQLILVDLLPRTSNKKW
jgi:hypothetical protein